MEANVLEVLLDGALKGAVVMVVALIATSLMRHVSAARRHFVWAVAVSALLLIPLLSFVMPAWGVLPTVRMSHGVPVVTEPASVQVFDVKDAASSVIRLDEIARTPSESTVIPDEPLKSARPWNAAAIVWLTWAAGAAIVLLTIVAGLVRVAFIRRSAMPFAKSACRDAVVAMTRAERLDVELLEGEPDAMPMTWGVLRPVLLLPASAHAWPRARLHAVLRHELAHVKRRDAMWQLIGEVACALHWFNPLAWYAVRQMRIEREHACDDAVLTAGSRASEYAAELLDIARSMRAARASSMAAIAMARPRQLEGRLLAVLDDKRNRAEVARRWPVWIAAAFVVLPIAALQPGAAREAVADVPTQPVIKAVAAAPQTPIVQASALGSVVTDDQSPDCMKQSFRQMTTNQTNGVTRVRWETRNCKGSMLITGNARIAGDLSGFSSIDAGSKVEIETKGDGERRQLTLTPAANGFAYVYEVDGERRAWDNEGKAWLSSVLTLLVRRGGFAADERIEHLLRTKGVNGVLEEVALLDSDYTQRIYLTKLMSKATLNGGAVRSVINVAHRELESDYELTQVLIAIAGKHDFTDESRAAYIQATTSLDSDYEHRRALSAVLTKGGLNSEDVTAVFVSARSIDSDYEKAEVLISAAGRYAMDQRSRTAYLQAMQGMNSDHEQRRVYTALLKQNGLTASDVAQILEATTTMESSYERGQVLQLASAQVDLTKPELQQAYVKAAAEIDSDYELRQTLNAVLKRSPLAPAALDVVIAAASNIDSDYERTEVLVQLVRNHVLNAAQRSRVAKMAEEMNSEHERGRVASALLRQTRN